MRTRLRAREEYEKAWSGMRSVIDQKLAEGERDPVAILESVWVDQSKSLFTERQFQDHHALLGIRSDRRGMPSERVVVRDGVYRRLPFDEPGVPPPVEILASFLNEHSDRFDCVVELGSGYGRNLLKLHHSCGNEPVLHACELTDAGRALTEMLRDLAPGIPLDVHPFDYYSPDLSFLNGGENVLLFTVHSIEQIPDLSRSLFDEILLRTASCVVFHFEPVGWQYDNQLRETRKRRDSKLGRFRRYAIRRRRYLARRVASTFGARLRQGFPDIELRPDDIDSSKRVARNSAEWSARLDYNKNLVPLLRSLRDEGRIRIDLEERDVFGDNPFNPTTVIRWTKL